MGFEPMIEVLQTSALPLGYVAVPTRFYLNRSLLSNRQPRQQQFQIWRSFNPMAFRGARPMNNAPAPGFDLAGFGWHNGPRWARFSREEWHRIN